MLDIVLQAAAALRGLPAHSAVLDLRRAAVHRHRVSISHHNTGGAQLNGTGGVHTYSVAVQVHVCYICILETFHCFLVSASYQIKEVEKFCL